MIQIFTRVNNLIKNALADIFISYFYEIILIWIFFIFIFPHILYAETKLLDEYVIRMQNGCFNRPAKISTISTHSLSSSDKEISDEKISDEEFYEFMSMVNDAENEYVEFLKNSISTKTAPKKHAGSIKIYNSYYNTNKKPGYLLFNSKNDDHDYNYNYRSAGFTNGLSYKFSGGASFDASCSRRASSESMQDEFKYQKISLGAASPFFHGYKISANFNQLSSDIQKQLNEAGFDLDSPSAKFNWGCGFSNNIYACGRSSFESASPYRRYYLNMGYELNGETYLQLMPAFEDYHKDKNKKSEIITSFLYYPSKLANFNFDLYHRVMGFKKNEEMNIETDYFAPESNTGMGFSINYRKFFNKSIDKSTILRLNLSLDNEKYTYNDTQTQYYTLSATSKFSRSFSRYFNLDVKYGFSISRSDGFPLTQNLKIDTFIKF